MSSSEINNANIMEANFSRNNQVIFYSLNKTELQIISDEHHLIQDCLDEFIKEIQEKYNLSKFNISFLENTRINLIQKYNYDFHIEMKCLNLAIEKETQSTFFIEPFAIISQTLFSFFQDAFKTEKEQDTKKCLNDFKEINKPKTILVLKDQQNILGVLYGLKLKT